MTYFSLQEKLIVWKIKYITQFFWNVIEIAITPEINNSELIGQ